MFGEIVAVLGILVIWGAWTLFRKHRIAPAVIFALIGLFFLAGGMTSIFNGYGNGSSSTSSSSSSEDSSSSKQESTNKKHKKQAEQGVKDINNKIAQDPQLNGLKVKLDKYDTDGDNYDVQIPDSALGGSDSQLREICKNVFTIIKRETGNQNPTVFYYDESGNEIAKTKWDGSIKLDN